MEIPSSSIPRACRLCSRLEEQEESMNRFVDARVTGTEAPCLTPEAGVRHRPQIAVPRKIQLKAATFQPMNCRNWTLKKTRL